MPIRTQRGFTLIELLVVLALLGILMGLIVTASVRSRASASRVTCAANLRQLGSSLVAYNATHGKYPVGIDRPSGYTWIWPALLRDFLGGGTGVEVFHCPSAPDESRWSVAYGSGLPAQDGYRADEIRLRPGGSHFMSYGYNVWGAFTGNGLMFEGLGVYKDDPWRGSATVGLVRRPSAMIALGDSNWDLRRKGDPNWSGFIGMYAERQWPLEMHGGRANLVFCDGHVEALPREGFIAQLAAEDDKAHCERRWNRSHQAHRY